MDEREMRKALEKHESHSWAFAMWMTQFTLLAAAIGYAMKSWWVFGITLFSFWGLTWVRTARRIMAVVASLLWGGIGWEAGRGKDLGMSVVLGLIFLVFGIGANALAMEAIDEEVARLARDR